MLAAPTTWGKTDIEKYHDDIAELSVEDNIMSPDVPKKALAKVKNKQATLTSTLTAKGLKVERMRNDLVRIITVPVSELFAPNDTVLSTYATKTLDLFVPYLKVPDMYKVLVVVHSDNTGSEEYLNHLTDARSQAIVDYFSRKKLNTDGVIPYGYGTDEPLAPNDTRANRAMNRRVDFYFIPGPEMIERAKNGTL
jgi:outer membrane protein OmpA-like peptidoglycan-associated protein